MFKFPEMKFQLTDVSESLVCSCVNRVTCNDKVFKGTFNSQSVAVKKFSFNCTNSKKDEQHWERLIKLRDDHVIQYHQCSVQNGVR